MMRSQENMATITVRAHLGRRPKAALGFLEVPRGSS